MRPSGRSHQGKVLPISSIIMIGGNFSLLCWNCRGAGSMSFLRNVKDLIKRHKPEILALLEPRIGGETAKSVSKKNWERKVVQS